MNLDLESARIAQNIIKNTAENKPNEVENLMTKTLGVLQENGIYACMLYLYSRTKESEKEISRITRKALLEMTALLGKELKNDENAEKVMEFLTDNICNDLDTLFLTKQLWEQTLVYVRYGTKART